MPKNEHLQQEIETLRDRLSKLSEASLRINESLDFDTVLAGVLASACSLTGARYGVITLLDGSGEVQDHLSHGMPAGQAQEQWEMADPLLLFEYLSSMSEPLRIRDLYAHVKELGLLKSDAPTVTGPALSFLCAPIRPLNELVGHIYLGDKVGEQEFTPEDQEILVVFASQAALVIANARSHREEQRARAGLEVLVNTSPVGVLVFNARSGEVMLVNREARRIVSGLHGPDGSAEQVLEVLIIRRSDGRELSLQEFPLAQALSNSKPVRAEEIVLRVPDGRSVTILINATPIRLEEGAIESVVVTMQDLTSLEELNRMRAEFLGMVSHELRRPLTSIKGSASTLLEAASELDPAEIAQFHRIINEQADYMRSMISDLLDVARIETGSLAVHPRPEEIVDIVDEARNAFLSGDGRDNIRIDLAPDLPLVMADRRRIVQVLSNLLANAAKYSKQTSAITVSVLQQELHVAVAVTDEGEGIAAERLPLLFSKFSQINGGKRNAGPNGRGTGLGLAICKGIVEAHGGRVWAESDGPDLGSRFTFTVPAIDEQGSRAASAPAQQSAERQRAEAARTRVLVVDDDPQTLRYVRDELTRAGYTAIVTGHPNEVSALIAESRPDLVLLDLMLPGEDGIELMQRIFTLVDVPVIFISGYGRDEVIARAFEMGASDYVVKPFSPTELMARIKAALSKRTAPGQGGQAAPYVKGELTINYAERLVTVGAQAVPLTATEYRMLVTLASNAGRVLTHPHLLQQVWGPDNDGDPRPLRTVVKNIRRKLNDSAANPQYVFTAPRVGYRMAKAETPDPVDPSDNR